MTSPERAEEFDPGKPAGAVGQFDPTVPIGVFSGAELESADSFGEFLGRLYLTDAPDCRYVHAPSDYARATPGGLVRGRNLFGPGRSPGLEILMSNRLQMNSVASMLLANAIVSPRATTVQSVERGFLESSVVNLRASFGALSGIAALENEIYRCGEDGSIYYTADAQYVQKLPITAIPVCGSGFHNFGHFLYDGLPGALQYVHAMPGRNYRIVGPPLSDWQRELLQALSCLDLYLEMTHAAQFSRVLVSDMLSLHLSYPTRFLRNVLDTVRFVLGTPRSVRDRSIFLSRASQRRRLVNRSEVEDALRAEGIEIIHPEKLSVAEQVSIAASSRLVVGESGAGMANVGFCDPGAAVLEIQPESFFDSYVRSTCFLCALDWHVYFARNEAPESAPHDPAVAPFHVDVPSLVEAVRIIKADL